MMSIKAREGELSISDKTSCGPNLKAEKILCFLRTISKPVLGDNDPNDKLTA